MGNATQNACDELIYDKNGENRKIFKNTPLNVIISVCL
jgi:hypothetical protein